MGARCRKSDRATRAVMRSPGRPSVACRGQRQRFWAAIARGVSTVDAAGEAGVSEAVGVRWFREAEVSPGRSFLPRRGCGGRRRRTAASALAHLGPVRFRQDTGIRVRPQIVAREFVRSVEVLFQVRGELAGTQRGTFLDAHMVNEKQPQIRNHHEASGRLALFDDLKPVCARVLLLLEPQVSDFHRAPFELPTTHQHSLER